jgi:serine/threonine-protein kinase
MLGRQIGTCRLDARLGAGGSGVVYRAYDLKLQRTIAIKLLSTEGGDRLLLREARAASGLSHPNICILHGLEDLHDPPFFVMEYVAGTPLNVLVRPNGLATGVVLRDGIQIAQALEYAHQHGVIHRDLKSANVIITPEGLAKILDFGLAKRNEQAPPESTTIAAAGMVQGTLSYLAPEVLRGEAANAQSDVWALGVLLYEMTTGNLPLPGEPSSIPRLQYWTVRLRLSIPGCQPAFSR